MVVDGTIRVMAGETCILGMHWDKYICFVQQWHMEGIEFPQCLCI
jgi:hypothetical protein